MAKLGKATIDAQGSFANTDISAQLVSYRKVIATNYQLTGPDEIERRLGIPLLVSIKLDGELWFLLHDGEWKLVSPTGRVISGDIEILQDAKSAKLDTTLILAGELYIKGEGRTRIADVTSALAGGDKTTTANLAFGAFDIVSSSTVSASGTPYSARYEALAQVGAGQNLHFIAHTPTRSGQDVAEAFERDVESGGNEGLVARSDDGRSYKIKPTRELDAAILGFTERRESDGSILVRSLLFGLLQEDGSWIPIATTGNVGDTSFRKELHDQLVGSVKPSSYRKTSESSGLMYQLVQPMIMVELRCLDIQLEDMNGKPIKHPKLRLDSDGWKVSGWSNSAAIHNCRVMRVRGDKIPSYEDVGWTQITRLLPVTGSVEEATLGSSELVRRQVWTKEGAGKTDVRKLVIWKTNKEVAGYPAFVIHWTDYSSTRKSPLDREVRLAPSSAEAEKIAEAMVSENIKKGWNLVS